MNKHIELVKKWLDNPDSVTAEELRVNAYSAYDIQQADYAAYAAYDADALAAAAAAAADAADAAAADAKYYVEKYEELTRGEI